MSNKGKVLTLELVFNKTKSDNLQSIKNLNLWGNELEDLQLIDKMPNLQVISLSVNKISSLRDFAKCNKLQELYLRKNCITDLREIRHLIKLPSLKVLWLHDNPCALEENYREIVIHHLPNLGKLDNNIITQEERTLAQKIQFDLMVPNNGENENYYQPSSPTKEKPQSSKIVEEKKIRPYSELPKQQNSVAENNPWRGGSNKDIQSRNYESVSAQQSLNRNKNILIAVLSLIKQLDMGGLQIVNKQMEKLMMSKYK